MAFQSRRKLSPYVIYELDADPVTTRYYPLILYDYQNHLTSSGEYVLATEKMDRTSHRLVSRKLPRFDLLEEDSQVTSQNRDDQQVHLDNVICYPSRLADGDHFLLLGKNDDEKMRLLIAPREGRALEIIFLSFSFNEAKRRLEAEWEKRRALGDMGTGGTGGQSAVMEENSSEENENRGTRESSPPD